MVDILTDGASPPYIFRHQPSQQFLIYSYNEQSKLIQAILGGLFGKAGSLGCPEGQ